MPEIETLLDESPEAFTDLCECFEEARDLRELANTFGISAHPEWQALLASPSIQTTDLHTAFTRIIYSNDAQSQYANLSTARKSNQVAKDSAAKQAKRLATKASDIKGFGAIVDKALLEHFRSNSEPGQCFSLPASTFNAVAISLDGVLKTPATQRVDLAGVVHGLEVQSKLVSNDLRLR
jgi:hypothetical protein